MIIVMRPGATTEQIATVRAALEATAEGVDVSVGQHHTVLGYRGDESQIDPDRIAQLPGTERVIPIDAPYRLVASHDPGRHHTVVEIGGVAFGAGHSPVIAGPCAVESLEQMRTAAGRVKAAGARVLRGEAFKPRTSPYEFQGLGVEGLRIMRTVADEVGLPFVAEIVDLRDLEAIVEYADAIRIGTRSAQNFALLAAVGEQSLPVILKRGLASTHQEWLMAAEYIAGRGNSRIILCARGIRTFEDELRNTPDIAAIPVVQQLSHLPVIFDPSHSGGRRQFVSPLSRAALATGADGLMIDVHPDPSQALVDGPQALTPSEFDQLMQQLQAMGAALDMKL